MLLLWEIFKIKNFKKSNIENRFRLWDNSNADSSLLSNKTKI